MTSVSALDKLKADLEAKRKLREEQLKKGGGSSISAPSPASSGEEGLVSPRAGPTVPSRHAPPPPGRHAPPPPTASLTSSQTSVPSHHSPPPIIPTAEPEADEFSIMMEDLGFPLAQRQQMLLLPQSHKNTLIQQWKKKKEEKARAAGLVMVSGGGGSSQRASTQITAPPSATHLAPPTQAPSGPTVTPSPEDLALLVEKKAALDKLREDLARRKKSMRISVRYGLHPDDPVTEAIVETVEKRKQEKLEALNKLKEKLAEKRKNINIQAASVSTTGEKHGNGAHEDALQQLMANLEEKRQKRREERQKKKIQKRASRAASIRVLSAITAGSAEASMIPPALVATLAPQQPELKSSLNRGQSLAQLQNAIKSADENKKARAALNQDSKEAREKRRAELLGGLPADLVPLTPEEKKIQRESRRIKRESKRLDKVSKEFAIDNQLGTFLQTLTKLEEEFKRQANERIEKQMQFDLLQKENQRLQNKINTVEEVLAQTKEKMNKLSSTIDRCISRNPSDIDLNQTQFDLNDIRKGLGMEEVFNTLRDEQEREAEKAAAEAAAEKAKEEAEAAPVSGLLAAIRGANLKKVSNLPPPPPAPKTGGGDILGSLQDTLRDALNLRKNAIMDSDSESESDSDDDDWLEEELEDYEDLLDMMNTPVNI